ncbi:MAG: hypothetical protein VYA34_14100 [Myxococcota bacterium]|nr:hypothetical protein [Myxococcota bacterium]
MNRQSTKYLFAFLLAILYAAPSHGQRPLSLNYSQTEAHDSWDYSLELALGFAMGDRTNFNAPPYLFPYLMEHIQSRAIRFNLDLILSLTERTKIQFNFPLIAREVWATQSGLQVSSDQTLPPKSHQYLDVGAQQPSLNMAYQFARYDWGYFALETGVSFPVGNPGISSGFPKSIPTSHERVRYSLGGSSLIHIENFSIAANYLFHIYPGNSASYLLRRFHSNFFTNGSFVFHYTHQVKSRLNYQISRDFTLALTPSWQLIFPPDLKDYNGITSYVRYKMVHEILMGAAIQYRIDSKQSLSITLTEPIISNWDRDPFFPITLPTRSIGIAWCWTSY